MWVALKEPIKNIDFEAVAIHLETFNALVIFNLDNKFHLAVMKYFDGHQSNQSNMHCLLGFFDTYKQTQDCFQGVLVALQTGEKTLDLRAQVDSENQRSKSGYV